MKRLTFSSIKGVWRVALALIVLSVVGAACVTGVRIKPAPSEQIRLTEPATSIPATNPPEATPTEDQSIIFDGAMRPGYEDDVDAFAGGSSYRLKITLSENPLHIDGEQRVRYHNTSQDTLGDVVFRLHPNALAGEPLLVVGEVMVGGRAARTELSVADSVLRVFLDDPLPPGASVEIDLKFAFDLPPDVEIAYGRLSDAEGVASVPTFFPVLSVYRQGNWWTGMTESNGDPGYSKVALYEVELVAPSSLVIASSGTIVEKTPHPDGTTTYSIVTGPVRDFALAYSRDFDLLSETREGVSVNVWSAFGDDTASRYALETAFAALAIFDEQFGDYPFNELDLVEAPVSALGIEYPGLIYLTDRIWQAHDQTFEWVIVHEIAHQWWYSMVGNDQVDEPWLDEGLAEYSVEVYYRELVGPRAGEAVRDRYLAEWEDYHSRGNAQMPIGLPVGAYSSREYRIFVYSGGALIYGHLADQYGDGKTRELLRAYYAQYSYDIAHNGDMERLVAELLGPDAAEFYAAWVYGGGTGAGD